MKGTIYYKSRGNSPVKHAIINDLYHNFGDHSVRGKDRRKDINYGIVVLDARESMGKKTDVYFHDFRKNLDEIPKFFADFKSKHCCFFSYEDYETYKMGKKGTKADEAMSPRIITIGPDDFPEQYEITNTYFSLGRCLPVGTRPLEDRLEKDGFELQYKDSASGGEEAMLIDFVLNRESWDNGMTFNGAFDGLVVELDDKFQVAAVYVISNSGVMEIKKDAKYLRTIVKGWTAEEDKGLGDRILSVDSDGDVTLIEQKIPRYIMTKGASSPNPKIIDVYETQEDKENMVVRRTRRGSFQGGHYPRVLDINDLGPNYEDFDPAEINREMGFHADRSLTIPPTPRGGYSGRWGKISEDKRTIFRAVFKREEVEEEAYSGS